MKVRCACGRELHYSNPKVEAKVQELVDELGPDLPIRVEGLGTWLVPRHYLALHGIVASELPALAASLGFPPA